MLRDRWLNSAKDTVFYIFLALKALRFWRKEPPITTVEEMIRYCETRAKFVAQTTLYGYIRTRAGTQYTGLMRNPDFVHSVNIAKWEIYLDCMCDFASYLAACAGQGAGADDADTIALATHLVREITERDLVPKERPQGFQDACQTYLDRVDDIDWSAPAATSGAAYFERSLDALVEWAPIADELKVLDVEIVKNSMRFKWKRLREQVTDILDPAAVMSDWQS
jgi:hypothetical protein